MKLTPFKSDEYHYLIDWITTPKFNYQWGGPAFNFPLTYEQIEKHCSNQDISPFLFHCEGQLAGYIEFRKMPSNSCRICRVLILEGFRGKGVAKEMLQLLISTAKQETGCNKFSLSVFEHNTAAVQLYTSLGFNLTERTVRPENLCGKTWVALEMEARL